MRHSQEACAVLTDWGNCQLPEGTWIQCTECGQRWLIESGVGLNLGAVFPVRKTAMRYFLAGIL